MVRCFPDVSFGALQHDTVTPLKSLRHLSRAQQQILHELSLFGHHNDTQPEPHP
jgi:hypothetical protein